MPRLHGKTADGMRNALSGLETEGVETLVENEKRGKKRPALSQTAGPRLVEREARRCALVTGAG